MFILSILFILSDAVAFAQDRPDQRVFNGAPAASWIAHPTAAPDAYGVYHFRRVVELPTRPERFVVHVSADNRYRLFVNGRQVSSGPQRSDLAHWRYETVDLAPYLSAGRNVLGATVWNWGPQYRPVAQFSARTAFLLQGDGAREAAAANSGADWTVLPDEAYAPLPVRPREDLRYQYYAAPPGEQVDGARYPWGWELARDTARGWVAAGVVGRLQQYGVAEYGTPDVPWQLVPRSIPPMEEAPVRFAAVRRAEGVRADSGVLRGTGDLVVPARTAATLLLDQAQLTNAFPVLVTSGGEGSAITLTYAEALFDSAGRKGNRNEIEGKTIRGVRDVIRPGGGERRRFQTLWFRTYRYVQLEIQTADEPLRLHDVHGVFVGYPLQERARFASDLPWLADMWAMNWRGARLDAWETYFDTPYYEQLQYAGDTRIQALITLYVSGDDRLVRQAVEHYDLSRIPEGITASRYPSALPQYIPSFSLVWVAMVHDYWMLRDDPAFVRRMLPGVRGVLAWFGRQVDSTGMLGPMPWWGFVDWAHAWQRGAPPGAERGGHSAAVTLQFAYALRRAAEIEAALGQPASGTHDRALADSLCAAVRARAWDARRRLFRDAPDTALYSQQTNVLAILAGAVPAAEQRGLMERLLADTTLVPASYYFSFYVFEALRQAGLAERYVERLAPWRGMLALGLTTTPETPEPTRSDSHAWSAHPNYGLLATVLGVRPASAGFRTVRIAPALGPLRRAEGRVPHPRGDIEVRLERAGESGVRGEVTLPAGVTGSFEWGGRSVSLRAGTQRIEM